MLVNEGGGIWVSMYLLDGDPGCVRGPLKCDLLVNSANEVDALSGLVGGLVGGPLSDLVITGDGFEVRRCHRIISIIN
jgi:hypothetical protein